MAGWDNDPDRRGGQKRCPDDAGFTCRYVREWSTSYANDEAEEPCPTPASHSPGCGARLLRAVLPLDQPHREGSSAHLYRPSRRRAPRDAHEVDAVAVSCTEPHTSPSVSKAGALHAGPRLRSTLRAPHALTLSPRPRTLAVRQVVPEVRAGGGHRLPVTEDADVVPDNLRVAERRPAVAAGLSLPVLEGAAARGDEQGLACGESG